MYKGVEGIWRRAGNADVPIPYLIRNCGELCSGIVVNLTATKKLRKINGLDINYLQQNWCTVRRKKNKKYVCSLWRYENKYEAENSIVIWIKTDIALLFMLLSIMTINFVSTYYVTPWNLFLFYHISIWKPPWAPFLALHHRIRVCFYVNVYVQFLYSIWDIFEFSVEDLVQVYRHWICSNKTLWAKVTW